MSDAIAEQAINFTLGEAKAQSATDLEIIFFGGEPLIRLDQLCSIADRFNERKKSLNVSFKLSTNGLLLNETARRALSKRNVYVSVSLDGPPETQEQQRPTESGRKYAERLASLIPEWLAWNPCMNVTTVVSPEVANYLDQSIIWLVEQGFSYVSVALDFSADWTSASMRELESAMNRLADRYINWHKEDRKIFISCFDSRIQSHIRANDEQCACSFGWKEFSIAASGRLYPCVQFVANDYGDSEYIIGNIDSGFDGAYRSCLHKIAKGEKNECHGCALDNRCTKWCACINWSDTGRIDRTSPTLCHYEKMLIPIADRIAAKLYRKRDPLFIHRHYNPDYPVLNFLENLVIQKADKAGNEKDTAKPTI